MNVQGLVGGKRHLAVGVSFALWFGDCGLEIEIVCGEAHGTVSDAVLNVRKRCVSFASGEDCSSTGFTLQRDTRGTGTSIRHRRR